MEGSPHLDLFDALAATSRFGARSNPAALTGRLLRLQAELEDGTQKWPFREVSGYLLPLLDSLGLSVKSQVAVFSATSAQRGLISADNPRVVYFGDDVAVGWVRGSRQIEIAEVGSNEVAFYTVDQEQASTPRLSRRDGCQTCHQAGSKLPSAGLLVLSTPESYGGGIVESQGRMSDHRTPFRERWGGWYVTGRSAGWRHLGNRIGQGWLDSLWDQFDTRGYPTEYSDVVALMVLEHQAGAVNLITRLAADVNRFGEATDAVRRTVDELVDYLLFVDEAPLPAQIIPTSAFVDYFVETGPADAHGRTLREFDLHRRLFRYPCSYMIYSPAFDALPRAAKVAVYRRLVERLSSENQHVEARAEYRKGLLKSSPLPRRILSNICCQIDMNDIY